MVHIDTVTTPRRVNEAYQARNVFGRRKLYMNWGLWSPNTDELDDAALALVLRLGELAGFGPDTTLLDVGFGFGDQLIDWCRHANLGKAEGVNVCPEQTEMARRRIADAGFADRVRVRVGEATDLPFENDSFDAVTAVECAFHFHTREKFFRQARRVLRPEGRLVLADFIGLESTSRAQKFAQTVAARAWKFAPGSFCTLDEYRAQLKNAGFHDISIEVVTDRVIPPGMRYARRRLHEADVRTRMQPLARVVTTGILALSGALGDPLPGEYVLVRAQ